MLFFVQSGKKAAFQFMNYTYPLLWFIAASIPRSIQAFRFAKSG